MKTLKLALLTVVAALLSFPAAASSFDQLVSFRVNPGNGHLVGIDASTFWNVDDALELGLFRAEDLAWEFEMINAHETCGTCDIVIEARDVDGMIVSTDTFGMARVGSDSLFTVDIHSVDQAGATNFVHGLVTDASIVQLEIRLELEAVKDNNGEWASIQTDAYWAEALIASDLVVVPVFTAP